MAGPYYVRGTAGGTNNGSSWANAWTSLSNVTGLVASDKVFVTEEALTGGLGTTPVFGSFKINRIRCICVNHSGSVPPVSADLRTTGGMTGSSGVNTQAKGCFYMYGLNWRAGAAAGTGHLQLCNNNNDYQTYDTCTLELLHTSGSDQIQVGLNTSTKGGKLEFFDTNCKFAAAGQSIAVGDCDLWWRGGAAQGTAPTTLFTDLGSTSTAQCDVLVEAVDLSLVTGTLVGDFAVPITFRFKNCKLGAGVAAQASQTQDTGATTYIQNSDSGSTNYRNEKHHRRGDQTTETTVVMTGGASDGTTPFSDKIVTTANCDFTCPFEVIPYEIWCDVTGSAKTITVELLTDNVTLKDNEAFAVLDTLQTSGFPTGTLARSAPDLLAAGSNIGAGTGTGNWTTTGLGTPVSQKIAFTFTPQKKGLVTVYLFIGKASTTVYVNPPTTLT